MAQVASVNISLVKGVRKQEVERVELKRDWGILGDAHAGNWHRQISLLAEESIDKMRAMGLADLTAGAFAENINTTGIDLAHLPVGTRLQIGLCQVEITQIGKDCHNDGCAIQRATGRCVMPTEGVFAIVVDGGVIRKGDAITIVDD